MTCAKKALTVVVVTTLFGLWGCTQSAAPNSASNRLRELEARNARLEDDYKSVALARDQARQKANLLEEQRAQLAQQVEYLQGVAKECDEMRKETAKRTAQRDAMQTKLNECRTTLLNIAQQMEQSMQENNGPPLTAAPAANVEGGPKS
jgi:outer membrane murein-binding lipoprotein Lpp